MFPFAKILCPTDFSAPSLEALDWACALTRHFGGELLLLHVVTPIPAVASAPGGAVTVETASYQQQLVDEADRELWQLRKDRVPDEVRSAYHVAVGSPAQAIARTATQREMDLIVIATHGHTGWRRFVAGSVAERVVREADCPVLTLQPSQREEP